MRSVIVVLVPLKEGFLVEVRAWRNLVCRHMNVRYKALMIEIDAFMEEQLKQLERPINDLEDVRVAMSSLEAIRAKQIDIDMSLGPIEVGSTSIHLHVPCTSFVIEAARL